MKTLDTRSTNVLAHVHPDLVKVITAAYASSTFPFIVINGLRTQEQERINVAKGASQTMHSRHLPNPKGLACAVDVMATSTGGTPIWNNNSLSYTAINAAVQQASHDLRIPVEWGGDWKTLKDWGHFQLPWAVYPADGSGPHLVQA